MDEMRYQLDLLKAMNQKLNDSEKMYRLISDTSNNAFLYYSFETNHFQTLGAWKKYFDFDIKEFQDISNIYDEVEDAFLLPLKDTLFLEKRNQLNSLIECKLVKTEKWLEFETIICYDAFSNPTDKIIRIKDISKLKRQTEELKYMAFYDSLTGLYNRNYFIKQLVTYVERAQTENSVVSVLFIDMDDFRKINDSLGILVGDELVQQFGYFLKELSDDNIIVCHMNSDIYCIAIYDPCGIRSVDHIYRTIKERVKQGFLLSTGQKLVITISIGVAEYPEASNNALELINCAEIVMFNAKRLGKNGIQYFDAPILHEFLQSVSMENELKKALHSQNFIMYYQPQFYTTNHVLRGVEGLIRWVDHTGNMISPSVFIPIAEKNGSIISIGNWVIDECIHQFAEWKRKYGYSMTLSINISAIQYKRSDFVPYLLQTIKKYGISPKEIELEITESILIDDFEEVINKLHILRDYGILVSLDDFGTGFSSLSYLKGLPIDTLKIDKTFIDDVVEDTSSKIITESVIDMVNRLGFKTVAEGVESQAQLDYLRLIGCDVVQGFYLAKPMPAEEIEQLLIDMI